MARNRKHQSAAILFGPALKALMLCLMIGGAGVGYVWQKEQIDELGKQMKQREIKLAELQAQNEKLRTHLSLLRSSRALEQRVRDLNLGLVQPGAAQLWRLPEPVYPVAPDSRLASSEQSAAQF